MGTAAPAVRERGGVMMRRARVAQRAGELVILPYGATIVVRPIRPADGPLLLDGFERLSTDSRRFRFLGGKSTLTSKDVHYLTEVDHRDHEAMVALDLAGRGVGVARYVRDPDSLRVAEVAIVVVDEWQRRGVGGQLLSRLARRAAAEGITCFTGVMADDNVAVMALVRSLGARIAVTGIDHGSIRFTIAVSALSDDLMQADHLVADPCFA
jgi:GNAT superfamily N-acetyltransferase